MIIEYSIYHDRGIAATRMKILVFISPKLTFDIPVVRSITDHNYFCLQNVLFNLQELISRLFPLWDPIGPIVSDLVALERRNIFTHT